MKYSEINVNITDDSYYCNNEKMTSLEGCPEIINGNFNCNNNELISLKYRPKIINGDFCCINTGIHSLIGCPELINGSLFCSKNDLKTLEGRPKKLKGSFYCKFCNLTTLKDSPKEIKDSFNCSNNPELKNVKTQIIKYQIKAKMYYTDEGIFSFKDIEKEFKEETLKILKNNKIKETNKLFEDYGLSIF